MKLFISYAHADLDKIDILADIFRSEQHVPWFDMELLPGQDWKAILLKEIRGCDAFVYALSPKSVASEWCQWEFAEAITASKPIIPVLLDRETQIPDNISRYQYADFSWGPTPAVKDRLKRGLNAIAVLIPISHAYAAPANPNGLPAQMAWTEHRKTLAASYMKTLSGGRQRRRTVLRNQHVTPQASGRFFGVDFGTTNSLCAVFEKGEPIVIHNRLGYPSTPSAVGIGLDGSILVGEAAMKFALQYPERCVLQVKRLFGYDVALPVDGKLYDPALLASYIIKSLKDDAEAYLGETVSGVVLTAPAYFDEAQHDVLAKAAELAGLEVLRIVAEPTAACFGYGIKEGMVAVYDLGGGTFDISILEIGDGVYEVRSVNGDTQLGGLDYDEAIVNYCIAEFYAQTGVDLSGDLVAQMRLREAAERAKIVLSTAKHTSVDVPFIAGDGSSAYHLSVPLTREKFDELTAHLTERTIACCQDALYISSISGTMSVDRITHLALVGLATRTPRVTEKVTAFFKKTPLRDVDPDTVVAQGAARQAAVLEGQLKDILLLDGMGHGLGIETAEGKIAVILEKNTTIPFRSTQVFTTMANQQTHARLHVLQGESQTVSGNTSLGQFVVDGIPPDAPGKQLVDVTFDIDANHAIQVHTYIHATGQSRSVAVTGAQPLYENLPDNTTTGEVQEVPDADPHPDDPFLLRLRPGDLSG